MSQSENARSMIKRTFGGQCLTGLVPVFLIIQVPLGHASLSSTARYTRVATKTISNTPSPLDRLRLEVGPPAGGAMAPALEGADISAAMAKRFDRHTPVISGAASDASWAPSRRSGRRRSGGHVEQCDECGATRIGYNSCRNPSLSQMPGAGARPVARGAAGRTARYPYFHVVFTLPAPVGEIAFQNKALVYAILFHAAAETLATIAADPKHLGAQHRLSPWSCTPGARPSPPACPLHRAGRRLSPRRHTLDRLQNEASSCRCASCRGLSGGCFSRPGEGLRSQAICTSSQSRTSPIPRSSPVVSMAPAPGLSTPSPHSADPTGARVSGPLHASGRHLQQPADLTSEEARSAFLEGLSPGRQDQMMTLEADEFIRRFLLHIRTASIASAIISFLANGAATTSRSVVGYLRSQLFSLVQTGE